MNEEHVAASTQCPACGRSVPVDQRYVTWCDACEWNVDPLAETNGLPAWRQRLERRLADTLYRELERGNLRRPGLDAARITAYVLSGLVLLLPAGCAVVGVVILVAYRPLWLAAPIGVIALLGAWLFRPRTPRLHSEDRTVSRDRAPRLYETLDRIADTLGTKRVTAVVIDVSPDVWFTEVGWRRQPVLGLGLPLWLSLRPQERVAILAHELGHGRNGDARHGRIVSNARSVLHELLRTFSSQPLDEWRRDLSYHVNAGDAETYVSTMTRLVNATVGQLVRGYAWLLDRAYLRGSQRSEYLADRRASEVAGSDATAWAMDRTVFAETAYRALERALRFESDLEPAVAVRRAVTEIPARELDRRLRVSRRRGSRTDSSHPPTYLRSKLIRARPVPTASVVLGLDDSATIDRELAAAGAPVLDEFRRSFPA